MENSSGPAKRSSHGPFPCGQARSTEHPASGGERARPGRGRCAPFPPNHGLRLPYLRRPGRKAAGTQHGSFAASRGAGQAVKSARPRHVYPESCVGLVDSGRADFRRVYYVQTMARHKTPNIHGNFQLRKTDTSVKAPSPHVGCRRTPSSGSPAVFRRFSGGLPSLSRREKTWSQSRKRRASLDSLLASFTAGLRRLAGSLPPTSGGGATALWS